MKIGDLIQHAKESIKKVRTARANSAVRELDVETRKPFSTATKIEDIVARVNSNEGLHLMYQLGSDVQVYRTVRALWMVCLFGNKLMRKTRSTGLSLSSY